MSATGGGVEQAAIQQYCKALRTPTIGTQFAAMAEQAQREEPKCPTLTRPPLESIVKHHF